MNQWPVELLSNSLQVVILHNCTVFFCALVLGFLLLRNQCFAERKRQSNNGGSCKTLRVYAWKSRIYFCLIWVNTGCFRRENAWAACVKHRLQFHHISKNNIPVVEFCVLSQTLFCFPLPLHLCVPLGNQKSWVCSRIIQYQSVL